MHVQSSLPNSWKSPYSKGLLESSAAEAAESADMQAPTAEGSLQTVQVTGACFEFEVGNNTRNSSRVIVFQSVCDFPAASFYCAVLAK